MANLNINTREGWNELARIANREVLCKMGIEPTEENYQAFIQEAWKEYGTMEIKYAPVVPMTYNNN